MNTKSFHAYTMFTGGMIGVGMFGLPYVLMHAGLLPTLSLGLLVLGIVWLSHLAFADLVLSTKGKKRLPGYVGDVLGPFGKRIAALANGIGMLGALLAYLLVGGTFLSLVLAPFIAVPPHIASIGLFVVIALILLRGVKELPLLEIVVLFFFLVALLALCLFVFPLGHISAIPLTGGGAWFVPYGVLLFSFWGLSFVPELVDIAGRQRARVRNILGAGFCTAALCYVLFACVIAAATGTKTTEDALTGLAPFVSSSVLWVGALFGFLNTFDSFLALGMTLFHTLSFDFRFSKAASWAITLGVPFFLFLLGVQSFIYILSITGAVFIGIEGCLVLIAYARKQQARRGLLLNTPLLLGVIGFFVLGIGLELFRTLVPSL